MARNSRGFCFRLHKADGRTILAVCDACLLGKKISQGDVEVRITESFYGSGKASAAEILKKAGRYEIVNVFGKDIVHLLIENGMVHRENVLWLGKIPHVQVIRM